MIETLLDFLCNSSDFRKEHNLGFIVRDENGGAQLGIHC